MPSIPAQRDDAVGGAKAPPQQTEDVEVADPFAVGDITLSAGEVLHVPSVDEDHLEAARVEDLKDRDPVDAGGFHRHVCHATRGEPVGEAVQIGREGRKRSHRGRITVRWYGDEMFRRPTIDPGGVRMETLEGMGRRARLRRRAAAMAFHGRLLYTWR